MYLSKGGRVTLINNTLSNLPTYFMSLFSLLASVPNRIEKFQCDFLWGGLSDEFKYDLVSCSKICSPLPGGGLGIRNLLLFNRALLAMALGYVLERVAMEFKFGSSCGGWHSIETSGAFGVGL
jgi:hypothetical protein